MSIISKYMAREYLKVFFLSLGAFVIVYLIVDLFERMDTFLQYQASFSLIITFFLFKLPLIVSQVIPLSLLFSALLTLGFFSRHNEITALKANGVSIYKTVLPLISLSFLISIFSLSIEEYLLPFANQQSKYLMRVKIKKEKPVSLFTQNKLWYRGEKAIYNLQHLDGERNIIYGLTIYNFDKNSDLVSRIDAKKVRWINGRWHFYEVISREFSLGNPVKTTHFGEKIIPLKETLGSFKIAKKEPEEMSYRELKEYINTLERQGYDSTSYQAALQAKLSFPFAGLIMSLLGIPFALRTGKSGGVALGVVIGIILAFIYWVFFAFSLSLGKSGVLPSLIAAWVSNFLFGLSGILLLLNTRQ